MTTGHSKHLWGGEGHRCGGVGPHSRDGFGDIQKSGHLPAHPCEEEETQREASVCYLPITPQEKRVGP